MFQSASKGEKRKQIKQSYSAGMKLIKAILVHKNYLPNNNMIAERSKKSKRQTNEVTTSNSHIQSKRSAKSLKSTRTEDFCFICFKLLPSTIFNSQTSSQRCCQKCSCQSHFLTNRKERYPL